MLEDGGLYQLVFSNALQRLMEAFFRIQVRRTILHTQDSRISRGSLSHDPHPIPSVVADQCEKQRVLNIWILRVPPLLQPDSSQGWSNNSERTKGLKLTFDSSRHEKEVIAPLLTVPRTKKPKARAVLASDRGRRTTLSWRRFWAHLAPHETVKRLGCQNEEKLGFRYWVEYLPRQGDQETRGRRSYHSMWQRCVCVHWLIRHNGRAGLEPSYPSTVRPDNAD